MNDKVVRKQENSVPINDVNGKGRETKNGEGYIFLRNGRGL
jgi:hypothetical protein